MYVCKAPYTVYLRASHLAWEMQNQRAPSIFPIARKVSSGKLWVLSLSCLNPTGYKGLSGRGFLELADAEHRSF